MRRREDSARGPPTQPREDSEQEHDPDDRKQLDEERAGVVGEPGSEGRPPILNHSTDDLDVQDVGSEFAGRLEQQSSIVGRFEAPAVHQLDHRLQARGGPEQLLFQSVQFLLDRHGVRAGLPGPVQQFDLLIARELDSRRDDRGAVADRRVEEGYFGAEVESHNFRPLDVIRGHDAELVQSDVQIGELQLELREVFRWRVRANEPEGRDPSLQRIAVGANELEFPRDGGA